MHFIGMFIIAGDFYTASMLNNDGVIIGKEVYTWLRACWQVVSQRMQFLANKEHRGDA
jgi:hypothetical protein